MQRGTIWMLCGVATLFAGTLSVTAQSAAAEEGKQFNIGPKFVLVAPANWVSKQPKINFIEYEFEVPVAEGDEIPGRVTVMGAGGGIEENVKRWESQFKPADGGEMKAEVKQTEIAGQAVHFVDLKGIYLDKAGPFVPGPAVERPNYRMLGAIITTESGRYFVKLYGPEKTITAAQPAFTKMVEGLTAK